MAASIKAKLWGMWDTMSALGTKQKRPGSKPGHFCLVREEDSQTLFNALILIDMFLCDLGKYPETYPVFAGWLPLFQSAGVLPATWRQKPLAKFPTSGQSKYRRIGRTRRWHYLGQGPVLTSLPWLA
jgi:hypothetical protein